MTETRCELGCGRDCPADCPCDCHKIMVEPGTQFRFRVRTSEGYDYAVRDKHGSLIETGWIDPAGDRHADPKIDGANLAAMVPVDPDTIVVDPT